MTANLRLVIAGAAALAVSACASAYYASMERMGVEKRDILVDRVEDARSEQAEAQMVFTSALDDLKSLAGFDGGDLEAQYDKLSRSYDRAGAQARDVRARIDSVKDVGGRLFREWQAELKEYESADLRRRSEEQLRATRADFDDLVAALDRAADKMDPVLSLYNDQVLFLKHNLNARAISSLEPERARIEARVDALIREMNAAIAEADAFIAAMQ